MKLPTWTREERTQTMREELPGGALGDEYTETVVVYRCGDPAEEAFHHRCILAGFNLPEFDQWLAPHPESDGKAALLATRALAKAATGHWELRSHLKDLHANRVHVDRVDELKPLAATGAKVRQPFDQANKESREAAARSDADWQRLADAKWAEPQHANKSARAIAQLIDPASWNTTRRRIRKLS